MSPAYTRTTPDHLYWVSGPGMRTLLKDDATEGPYVSVPLDTHRSDSENWRFLFQSHPGVWWPAYIAERAAALQRRAQVPHD